jgi:hypothetical protein
MTNVPKLKKALKVVPMKTIKVDTNAAQFD